MVTHAKIVNSTVEQIKQRSDDKARAFMQGMFAKKKPARALK